MAGTVTLLVDGETVAIVDPGMVADRRLILDPLAHHGLDPEDVTDVIFSHHHPDHTLNAALFPEARFHDHMAIYHDDIWEDRDADGYQLSPSITLMTTPGHTAEDVSTLVDGGRGPGGPDPSVVDRRRAGRRPLRARPRSTAGGQGEGPGSRPGPDRAGTRCTLRAVVVDAPVARLVPPRIVGRLACRGRPSAVSLDFAVVVDARRNRHDVKRRSRATARARAGGSDRSSRPPTCPPQSRATP